jgi:large subunit ribosomal protein L22
MIVKSKAKWVRSSPLKVRRIVKLIVGKNISEAVNILKLLPHKGARIVEKVLNSAIANAVNNYKLKKEELIVARSFVDSAAILKRWRAQAKGRGAPIKKRTCHVTVCIEQKGAES